ncbi:ISAon1 family transposase N-terminal region protein [Dyadobacter jejuensis]|uniref:ISAon1 family transposase N-terminal region protein n=1 Tax=Dyadobacter jejuensis TaxID=1082580 RepID=UPI00404155B2
MKKKNIAPEQYKDQKVESKGFLPEIQIQDFPIRNQKVMLCIKRRRWEVKPGNEIISRDWKLVQKGTRITSEFAAFLKGMY